jgi:hypothetical protein
MDLRPLHGLDADATLARAPGANLLVLTSPGCGACRALLRAIEIIEPIEGLVAWGVDAGQAPGLVEELEVVHLPALFVYVDGEPGPPLAVGTAPGPLRSALIGFGHRGG